MTIPDCVEVLKETKYWLNTPEMIADGNRFDAYLQALTLAIEKLELLEKVEKTGVKKPDYDVASVRLMSERDQGYIAGQEQMYDLCNAHLAKKLEGIRGLISHFGQLTSKYPDKQHLLPGDDSFISVSQYDDLAQAIKNYMGE